MAVPNTDNISATTLQLIRRRIADNIFKANPTAAYLLSKGRVKTENGGKTIDETLIYAVNSTTQSYAGYDRLNVAPTQEITSAAFNWRQWAVSISISGEEELKNNGETAVFDLLKQKVKIAEMSLMEWLDEKMHEDATTKISKDPLGLDEIIDDQLNYSTLGSIDSNTYTFWQNKIGPGGDGATTLLGGTGDGESDDPVHITASSTVELSTLLTRMMNVVGRGITSPDLIITAEEVYERYENDNRTLARKPLTDLNMLNVGFDNLMFKGATMMWNQNIKNHGTGAGTTADYKSIYFLNSQFLSFTLHARRNFTISNFVSPWDQDARVAQILAAGNMTVNNRRHQGVCVVDLTP